MTDEIFRDIRKNIPHDSDIEYFDLSTMVLSSSYGFDVIRYEEMIMECGKDEYDVLDSDISLFDRCGYNHTQSYTYYPDDGRGKEVCLGSPLVHCKYLMVMFFTDTGSRSLRFSNGSFTCQVTEDVDGIACWNGRWDGELADF